VTGDQKLLVCAALSVAGHFALAHGLGRLPRQADQPPARAVSISVVPPPPPPAPPPEPEAAPPPKSVPAPRLARAERPRAPRPQAAPPREVAPREAPPSVHPAPDATATPVFGVTMESTSQAGHGPAMPVGNPLGMRSGRAVAAAEAPAKALGSAPVSAFEVTTMPLPQGRCAGAYTEEAKQAAVEGTVVLDLVVGEDGRTRDIHVASGLPHKLTEAAVAALKACRFSPGEKNGARVAVRVRGFKIQFVLQNDS